MENWFAEYVRDRTAKERLIYLRERAIFAIKEAVDTPQGPVEGLQTKLQGIVTGFRQLLYDGEQIDIVRKLRVDYNRQQRHGESYHDWATRSLGGMVDRIEGEIRSIEQRTNFRMAIYTALIASLSTLLAFVSFVVTILKPLFQD